MENQYEAEPNVTPVWPYDTSPETEDIREIKREIRRGSNTNALIMLCTTLIAELLLNVLGAAGVFGLIKSKAAGTFLSFTLSHPLAVSIVLLAAFKITGVGFKGIFRKPQRPPLWILKWIVIGMGLSYLSNYVIVFLGVLINLIFGTEMNTVNLISEGTAISAIVYFIALSIYAPIFEELLFRGALLSRTSRFGIIFSSIVVGLSFGVWHLNIQQFIYASVMGAVATFITIKTRSILPAMLLHLGLNFIASIQSAILPHIDLEAIEAGKLPDNATEGMYYSILSLIGIFCIMLAIAAIVLVILEFTKKKGSILAQESCPQLTLRSKLLTYFTAPLTILIMLAYFVSAAYSTFFK